MNRVKAEQHGNNILYTCYGKVLCVNGLVTKNYFTIIQSIKDELWSILKCNIKTH